MIKSLSHLEGVLGYKIIEMEAILSEVEAYYYHFAKLKGVVKGVKKYRDFFPSKSQLRHIQDKITTRIFRKIPLPLHLHGGIRRRGNVTNSRPHQGKHFRFNTDLRAYFDFVTNKMVYDALRSQGFSQKVSHILTRLTTLNGHLPQGAPTSPFLANLAGLPMDQELLAFCKPLRITYTRFVDDMAFSSQLDFKQHVDSLVDIIKFHGLDIGFKKTKYKIGRVENTGVSIGQNGLRPTQAQLEKYVDPHTEDKTRKGLDSYFVGLRPKKNRK